nr:MAG TPA: hypothetical protein [Caudoviricetes sp.]
MISILVSFRYLSLIPSRCRWQALLSVHVCILPLYIR